MLESVFALLSHLHKLQTFDVAEESLDKQEGQNSKLIFDIDWIYSDSSSLSNLSINSVMNI